MLQIKRIYDKPAKSDGIRILVDRLWPRGLSKEKARIDYWMKDIAPSNQLRRRYAHRPERWQEFRKLYYEELETKKELVETVRNIVKKDTVTLLYAAKDSNRNNAVVIKSFISMRMKSK